MEIRLPQLAEGVDSGTVVNVLIKPGDTVKKGQDLIELETKKAVATVPSPQSGTVTSVNVKSGDELSVGQVICVLGSAPGQDSAAKRLETEESGDAVRPAQEVRQDQTRQERKQAGSQPSIPNGPLSYTYESKAGVPPPASPTVRKMARELGIDLRHVRGSERGGRIVVEDLKTYIQQLQQMAFAEKPAGPAARKPAPVSVDFGKWGPVHKKPMSQVRKTIAERMLESKTTIPHVYQFDEADITALMDLRKKYQAAFAKQEARLTVTSFILKALITLLKRYPIFNSSLDETTQEIVYKDYYHIGLAVDTEAGLIVPVIRDVDKKNMVEISKAVTETAEKARNRKVSLQDLQGGTFTVSNQGGIGGAHFTPIINKPEAAILGLGQGGFKAVVRNGKVESRQMLPLCLSYDHRLIDGGNAARFIKEFREELENFNEKELKTQ